MANPFHTRFKHNTPASIEAKGGKTKQSAMADADINLILKKYNISRIPPPSSAPIFADRVILPETLEDAMGIIDGSLEWFESLPSEVRAAFHNDPVEALRLVHDDLPSAINRGLVPVDNPIIAKAAEAAPPHPQKEAGEEGPKDTSVESESKE